MPEPEATIPAKEPARNWVGRICAFDLHRPTGVTRERGTIESQRWMGLTARGRLPDWELVICGVTGKRVAARMIRDCVSCDSEPEPRRK